MISVETWAEIRRLSLLEKLGCLQIARRLDVDPKTVRRALGQARYPGLAPRPSQARPSMLDPHKPWVRSLLDEVPELTAIQVHERLRRDFAYRGDATRLRRFIQVLRREQLEAYLRLTHLPGKIAQVDWAHCGPIRIGQTTRRLSLFVMVLAYSRLLFACFTLSERMDAFLDALVRGLIFFGGGVERLLFDNMKTVVLDRRAGSVRFHPRLLELAGLVPFQPRVCPPRRPWHKGIVESAIAYVRASFLNGRAQPTDLTREQRDLDLWLAGTANVRLHAETRRRPIDLFTEIEKSVLRPLPTVALDTAHVDTVQANAFSEVRFDGNRYTVPHRYAHRPALTLRATPGEVAVFDGAQEIARHARSYERGRRVVDPEHERGLLLRRRRAERDTLLGRLRILLSDRADEYAVGLVRRELRSETHLRRILALADRYGTDEVRAALAEGLAHGAYGADVVENAIHRRRRATNAAPLLPMCLADELASIHVAEPDLTPYESLLDREGERSPEHEAAHGP
jgi:transposase